MENMLTQQIGEKVIQYYNSLKKDLEILNEKKVSFQSEYNRLKVIGPIPSHQRKVLSQQSGRLSNDSNDLETKIKSIESICTINYCLLIWKISLII